MSGKKKKKQVVEHKNFSFWCFSLNCTLFDFYNKTSKNKNCFSGKVNFELFYDYDSKENISH